MKQKRSPALKRFDGAIRNLLGVGKSIREVSDFIGTSYSALHRYCQRCEIPFTDGRGKHSTTPIGRNQTIIALYLENRTLQEVGDLFGITRERVRQILNNEGIKPRAHTPKILPIKLPKKRLTSIERFWLKVDKTAGPNACWPWIGTATVNRYGSFYFQGKNWYCHHLAFWFANRKRAKKWHLHSCDNPPCCNPKHIYDGTPQDNVKDRDMRKRGAVHRGNSGRRLTGPQVTEIRHLLAQGIAQHKIAELVGFTPAAINNISTGKTWSNFFSENITT